MLGGVWEMKGCKDGRVRCVGCDNGGVRVWWSVGDEGCVRMVE